MPRWLIFIITIIGLTGLFGCVPQTPTKKPIESVAPLQTPTTTGTKLIQLAAQLLNVDPAQVTVRSIEPVDFQDSCLGLGTLDEMCAQVITPGFRAVLVVGNDQIIVRSDQGFSFLRRESEPVSTPPSPAAAEVVRLALAARLNLPPEAVNILGVTAVDWGDACLGIHPPDQMCAQVITPGYRIELAAGDNIYVYHTNSSGNQAILAEAPELKPGPSLITWSDLNDHTSPVFLSREGILVGYIGGQQILSPYKNSTRLAELELWVHNYRSFSAETTSGSISLVGEGLKDPTVAEQRSMAEWAKAVTAESQPSASTRPPALTWRREGGIAGYCDELEITFSGLVKATSCRVQPAEDLQLLNPEELATFYSFLDRLAAMQISSGDENVADGIQIELTFNGSGQEQPSRDDELLLLEFAAKTHNRFISLLK